MRTYLRKLSNSCAIIVLALFLMAGRQLEETAVPEIPENFDYTDGGVADCSIAVYRYEVYTPILDKLGLESWIINWYWVNHEDNEILILQSRGDTGGIGDVYVKFPGQDRVVLFTSQEELERAGIPGPCDLIALHAIGTGT